MRFNRFILVFFVAIFLLPSALLYGQSDTLIISDSVLVHKGKTKRIVDPVKATMLAAAFPGMGQVYNRKAWKIPVVYAGFAAVGYFIINNSTNHSKYLDGYRDLTDDIPETNSYTFRDFGAPPEEFDRALESSSFNPQTEDWVKTQLINGVDYYRRYRDLSYVGVALWYLITILDANVDANLADYDISEDLSVTVEPVPIGTLYGSTIGVGVRVTF